jgi:AraC-like DNA-binding protein
MQLVLGGRVKRMNDIGFFLKRIYYLTGLPTRLVGQDGPAILGFGYDSEADPISCDPSVAKNLMERSRLIELPAVEIEDNNFLYGCCKTDEIGYIIVGPAYLHSAANIDISRYKARHGIPIGKELKLVPCQPYRFVSALSVIFREVCGKQADEDEIIKANGSNLPAKESDIGDYMDYVLDNSEQNIERFSYTDELSIKKLIVEGDLEGLLNSVDISDFTKIGKLASSSFKQYEYLAVSGITFLTRAAIEGGLKPGLAYNVSDTLLQKLEKCQTVIEIMELLKTASKSFTELVKAERERRTNSGYIEKCKSYIESHLYKPFSLDDLANQAGVNKTYLSRQFSRVEGIHIQEYIHKARIDAACYMLRYSDRSISSIAEYLCFNSQSHFGSVFKKNTHMTPQQYRGKMKVIDLQSQRK